MSRLKRGSAADLASTDFPDLIESGISREKVNNDIKIINILGESKFIYNGKGYPATSQKLRELGAIYKSENFVNSPIGKPSKEDKEWFAKVEEEKKKYEEEKKKCEEEARRQQEKARQERLKEHK